MNSGPLNILLIANDGRFARAVPEMLRHANGAIEVASALSFDDGVARLTENFFESVLIELSSADRDALANVSLLVSKVPRTAVVVFGPADDENFAEEIVHAGAQDYLATNQLDAHALFHAVHCAVERQHERMALIDARENYRGIFDHLVEGIFRTTQDGHYLLVNAALARIYGYDSPEDLMQNITDIAHRLYVDPARRGEFVCAMQEHDTLSGFESPIYRKDGSIIWISENCRAVRDAQGKLLYYEGTVEDITQRRQAEQALQNSESLYHSLVETMPQNVFRKDLQGRFTFANRQYCEHYHCKLEDILDKTDYDFFPKELAEKYERDDKHVMETGQTREIIEEHHPFGQEKGFVQVVKTPLYDAAGKTIGLQGIFWDITEKIRAEEQIRKTSAELARHREELRAKNALMEENLRMAREVQLAMLLQQYPTFPKNAPPEQSAFQFAHRYLPAETIGGDFFSVSALSDKEVGVFICDVTGHGVRSSLVTAMIRALVEELKPLAHDPGIFLRKLNSDLFTILKNTGSPMLTTAFYFVANWETRVLRFANAGHPKPLLIRRPEKRIELLRNASGKSQPALGLFDDPPYQTTEIALAPNDLVMLFTDGLYEVQGANEELYSQERLMIDVGNFLQKPAAQMFDELLETVRAFSINHEFEDDVCLVGMEFAPPQPKS